VNSGGDMDGRGSSTSAGAPMRGAVGALLIQVGFALAPLATASESADSLPQASLHPVWHTTSGEPLSLRPRDCSAISELRLLSGLTWEQLARLLGVARRSVHLWASGMALSPANEERLLRVLATIRQVDRGDAAANRAALFAEHKGGVVAFDLLARGEYEQVRALLGPGRPRRVRSLRPLSASARAARMPLSPDHYVMAIQDDPDRTSNPSQPDAKPTVDG
jgi:DNA-binding transcriptional regulator YiaG